MCRLISMRLEPQGPGATLSAKRGGCRRLLTMMSTSLRLFFWDVLTCAAGVLAGLGGAQTMSGTVLDRSDASVMGLIWHSRESAVGGSCNMGELLRTQMW